jgi:reactive intermediate/imine deaminase
LPRAGAAIDEEAIMSVEFLGSTGTGAGGQALPFSPAVRAGPFVFVSGQVAMGGNGEIVPGGIEAQTRQTLKNVERALALAGCMLGDMVKATVWLDDARDFWTFNRVYAEFFAGHKPARSTTQAKLMVDAKIEIEVIAYKA